MRSIERIPEVLTALRVAWLRNPDMRLGQVIIAAYRLGLGDRPPFTRPWASRLANAEDTVLLRGLVALADRPVITVEDAAVRILNDPPDTSP